MSRTRCSCPDGAAVTLFVGIDMGTSACRAAAIDEAGALRGHSSAALPAPETRGRCVEQAPELWWDALVAAVGQLTAQVPAGDIRAVAVDGTSGTLLLTDSRGNPLTPGLMYHDSRSADEARRVAAVAPAASAAHGASSALAKLLHLQQQVQAGGDGHALHQADWLAARLCGRYGVSDENNSLKLGYDPIGRRWAAWLPRVGVNAALLPRVVPPGTALGPVTAPVAERLGLPGPVQVIAGTTDSVAAFIAAGAAGVGEAVTSLGSTLVLKVLSDVPVFEPAYGVYSHRLGERWLVGGASNTGGAVLRRHFDDDRLAALSRALRPDRPTGLDYYPLNSPGERFPVNDPNLAPRLAPRPDDDARFLQGLLEGIARIEHDGYRRLQELGAPYPTTVRTVGGGARNQAWAQIRRPMLGVPLVEARHQEAAYGAALLSRDGYNAMDIS